MNTIATEHKTFNRQCDYIGTGNVYSNTQTSSYIRSVDTVECNGRISQPGHLRNFDLKQFERLLRPSDRSRVDKYKNRQIILYVFFHYRKHHLPLFQSKPAKHIHGIVITGDSHELLDRWIVGPTWKSNDIIEAVLPFIVK